MAFTPESIHEQLEIVIGPLRLRNFTDSLRFLSSEIAKATVNGNVSNDEMKGVLVKLGAVVQQSTIILSILRSNGFSNEDINLVKLYARDEAKKVLNLLAPYELEGMTGEIEKLNIHRFFEALLALEDQKASIGGINEETNRLFALLKSQDAVQLSPNDSPFRKAVKKMGDRTPELENINYQMTPDSFPLSSTEVTDLRRAFGIAKTTNGNIGDATWLDSNTLSAALRNVTKYPGSPAISLIPGQRKIIEDLVSTLDIFEQNQRATGGAYASHTLNSLLATDASGVRRGEAILEAARKIIKMDDDARIIDDTLQTRIDAIDLYTNIGGLPLRSFLDQFDRRPPQESDRANLNIAQREIGRHRLNISNIVYSASPEENARIKTRISEHLNDLDRRAADYIGAISNTTGDQADILRDKPKGQEVTDQEWAEWYGKCVALADRGKEAYFDYLLSEGRQILNYAFEADNTLRGHKDFDRFQKLRQAIGGSSNEVLRKYSSWFGERRRVFEAVQLAGERHAYLMVPDRLLKASGEHPDWLFRPEGPDFNIHSFDTFMFSDEERRAQDPHSVDAIKQRLADEDISATDPNYLQMYEEYRKELADPLVDMFPTYAHQAIVKEHVYNALIVLNRKQNLNEYARIKASCPEFSNWEHFDKSIWEDQGNSYLWFEDLISKLVGKDTRVSGLEKEELNEICYTVLNIIRFIGPRGEFFIPKLRNGSTPVNLLNLLKDYDQAVDFDLFLQYQKSAEEGFISTIQYREMPKAINDDGLVDDYYNVFTGSDDRISTLKASVEFSRQYYEWIMGGLRGMGMRPAYVPRFINNVVDGDESSPVFKRIQCTDLTWLDLLFFAKTRWSAAARGTEIGCQYWVGSLQLVKQLKEAVFVSPIPWEEFVEIKKVQDKDVYQIKEGVTPEILINKIVEEGGSLDKLIKAVVSPAKGAAYTINWEECGAALLCFIDRCFMVLQLAGASGDQQAILLHKIREKIVKQTKTTEVGLDKTQTVNGNPLRSPLTREICDMSTYLLHSLPVTVRADDGTVSIYVKGLRTVGMKLADVGATFNAQAMHDRVKVGWMGGKFKASRIVGGSVGPDGREYYPEGIPKVGRRGPDLKRIQPHLKLDASNLFVDTGFLGRHGRAEPFLLVRNDEHPVFVQNILKQGAFLGLPVAKQDADPAKATK